MNYQPKTGRPCTCKPGIQRDNCPACEGTGMEIDFRAIREMTIDRHSHIEQDRTSFHHEVNERIDSWDYR